MRSIANPLHLDIKKHTKYEVMSSIEVIINDSSKEAKYKRRKNKYKAGLHWGQLKLLLSEVEFFSLDCNLKYEDKATILYIGAAPGMHINILMEMYPNLYFIMYDPLFDKETKTSRYEIHKEYFTTDIAKTMNGKVDYFISDIRRIDSLQSTSITIEKEIDYDMKMQHEWYNIIRPKKASLKFRLPWKVKNLYHMYDGTTHSNEEYKYLKGKIKIQPFAGQTSSETRLIVSSDDDKEIYYNAQKYEDQLFYHNTVNRYNLYKTYIPDSKSQEFGLCNCYDCTRLILIHYYYTTITVGKKIDSNTMYTFISYIKKLGKRTLNTPDS